MAKFNMAVFRTIVTFANSILVMFGDMPDFAKQVVKVDPTGPLAKLAASEAVPLPKGRPAVKP